VRRWLRIAGTIAVGAGVLAAAWALTVWQWQDPFTALYTGHQQKALETDYARQFVAFRPRPVRTGPSRSVTVTREKRAIPKIARRYRRGLETGDAVGRLRVPRLGLNVIVINGTDSTSLTKGPGRHADSYVPGEGELIYVAGHRTTYSAPFASIDRLQKGDIVTFDVPYGKFTYRVRNHVIVPGNDIARLRSPGRGTRARPAIHGSRHQRYIVYATPVTVLTARRRPRRRGKGLDLEIPSGRARGQRALAVREKNQRVRRGSPNDHVRVLAEDGREDHTGLVGAGHRACQHVAARVAGDIFREHSGPSAAPGRRPPARASMLCATPDERETGFPSRPKTNGIVRQRHRLPGLQLSKPPRPLAPSVCHTDHEANDTPDCVSNQRQARPIAPTRRLVVGG
jgi:sortase A